MIGGRTTLHSSNRELIAGNPRDFRRDRLAGWRARRAAGVLLVVSLLAGCVAVQPRISPRARPSAASGYVGGLFAKDTIVGFGFSLRNDTTRIEYVLEVEDHAVGLIAVPPGRYRVVSWVTWAALTGEQLTRKAIPADSRFSQPFDLEAGQVMLLGSWFADRASPLSNTYTIASHPIGEAEAVAAFQAAYPGFSDLPVRCLICRP